MEQSLMITQLDIAARDWIEREAQRTGLSFEAIVRQLIYRGLEVERQKDVQQRFHDLDALAGTWSDEDADEFHRNVEDLNRIDPI